MSDMFDKKEWVKQIFQVVMVVENLDETLGNWKRLVEFDEASIEVGNSGEDVECFYRGEKIRCLTKYAVFDLGGVSMKLVEPLNKEGGGPYGDSLRKSGPGVHHLGFCTDDYDGLLEKYARMGQTPVFEEIRGENRCLLFDFTEKTGLLVSPWDHLEGPCARGK